MVCFFPDVLLSGKSFLTSERFHFSQKSLILRLVKANFVRRNQLLILFISMALIILLLISGVYLLLNNAQNTIPSMMVGETTSNNGVVSLILISVAVIILLGIILYFVFIRKERVKQASSDPPEDTYCRRNEDGFSTENKIATSENEKPYDVFLCYKKSSGKDFADHLKAGLEEIGLHTFQDCKDIPLTVDTQVGWASFRDLALEQSRYFVLIMTPGFNLSSEVVNEIGIARRLANKTFVFFRLRGMKRNIIVNLEKETLDIGKLEQVSFESKEELLRLAIKILTKGDSNNKRTS